MNREEFDRANSLLAHIDESKKIISKYYDILAERQTGTNRNFVLVVIDKFQSPGLMVKLADVAAEAIRQSIQEEKDNITHLENLFKSL